MDSKAIPMVRTQLERLVLDVDKILAKKTILKWATNINHSAEILRSVANLCTRMTELSPNEATAQQLTLGALYKKSLTLMYYISEMICSSPGRKPKGLLTKLQGKLKDSLPGLHAISSQQPIPSLQSTQRPGLRHFISLLKHGLEKIENTVSSFPGTFRACQVPTNFDRDSFLPFSCNWIKVIAFVEKDVTLQAGSDRFLKILDMLFKLALDALWVLFTFPSLQVEFETILEACSQSVKIFEAAASVLSDLLGNIAEADEVVAIIRSIQNLCKDILSPASSDSETDSSASESSDAPSVRDTPATTSNSSARFLEQSSRSPTDTTTNDFTQSPRSSEASQHSPSNTITYDLTQSPRSSEASQHSPSNTIIYDLTQSPRSSEASLRSPSNTSNDLTQSHRSSEASQRSQSYTTYDVTHDEIDETGAATAGCSIFNSSTTLPRNFTPRTELATNIAGSSSYTSSTMPPRNFTPRTEQATNIAGSSSYSSSTMPPRNFTPTTEQARNNAGSNSYNSSTMLPRTFAPRTDQATNDASSISAWQEHLSLKREKLRAPHYFSDIELDLLGPENRSRLESLVSCLEDQLQYLRFQLPDYELLVECDLCRTHPRAIEWCKEHIFSEEHTRNVDERGLLVAGSGRVSQIVKLNWRFLALPERGGNFRCTLCGVLLSSNIKSWECHFSSSIHDDKLRDQSVVDSWLGSLRDQIFDRSLRAVQDRLKPGHVARIHVLAEKLADNMKVFVVEEREHLVFSCRACARSVHADGMLLHVSSGEHRFHLLRMARPVGNKRRRLGKPPRPARTWKKNFWMRHMKRPKL